MNRVSLKNISKIINSGLTPLRSNEKFWLDGNIPWVKTEQLGEKYIYDSNEKITKFALENTSIKLNPANTLSIAMYGEGKTRGSVSILKNVTTTNQACCNIVIDENEADFEFVYYNLKTQYDNLRNLSSGVRKNLNSNDIKNFEILLPSLSTQKQIAKVLSDLDAKIEVNNKINQELEAMAKTLYDYWFVQFDFPDANGKPYKSSGGKMVFNEALKREIPEGWQMKTFDEILYTVNDSIEPDDYPNLSYLPIDKLPSNQLYYQEYSERENAKSSLLRFKEDDILLGAMRVYFHRVCNAIEDGISRSTIMVLRPHDVRFKNFCLFTLNRDETIEFANKNSTGSSIPYAKWEKGLSRYKIAVANNSEIFKNFNEITNPILNKFKILSKENQKLTELRDWLLPMLMNGQVTVGEAESDLRMVAEDSSIYKKEKTTIEELFEPINYDYEVATVVLLTSQILKKNFGKKYIHKMFSNIQLFEALPIFEDLKFQENGWGMHCPILEKTLKNQKYIYTQEVVKDRNVLNLNYKHIKEVSNWMQQDEYSRDFVLKVKQMLAIYQKSLINKDMDRIELLNTVMQCMHVLETDNFDTIWYKMEHWEMFEDGYKTKAEKFKVEETRLMIELIKGLKN